MNELRALIVDDEPAARKRLRDLLDRESMVRVVGECGLGREAVAALERGGQDVVFLDIRMPDMDGFEVLEAAGVDALPVVVFVSAYGDRALQAFDVHAVDYLLKPFDDERFAETLERVRRVVTRTDRATLTEQLRELVATEGPSSPATHTLAIRSGGKTTLLPIDEIRWVEAEGSYVRLHTAERDHLLRESMARVEGTLEEHGFLRIHRSSIVRLAEVRELRNDHAGHGVVLRDGTRLRVSERHWGRLQAALGM